MMLNKTITIDDVMSWNPCYNRDKILWLAQGKTAMTVEEIFDLQFVSAADKLWLLLREEIVPERTLHEFAIWCAETALTRANVTDERSWNAIKVKRLWLDGQATDKDLFVVGFSVGCAFLFNSICNATAAALSATWEDAGYSSRATTMAAARSGIAWDEQLAKLKEMLK